MLALPCLLLLPFPDVVCPLLSDASVARVRNGGLRKKLSPSALPCIPPCLCRRARRRRRVPRPGAGTTGPAEGFDPWRAARGAACSGFRPTMVDRPARSPRRDSSRSSLFSLCARRHRRRSRQPVLAAVGPRRGRPQAAGGAGRGRGGGRASPRRRRGRYRRQGIAGCVGKRRQLHRRSVRSHQHSRCGGLRPKRIAATLLLLLLLEGGAHRVIYVLLLFVGRGG